MKFLFAAIVACLSYPSYAQKSVINGYVVKLNGDTTKGYIDYKNWNKTPYSVSFYQTLGGQKQVLDTLTIKAFGVKNEKYNDTYIAQTIDIENSEQNISRMGLDPNPTFLKKTIFLQKILNGSVSILKHTDSNARAHYFIAKDQKIQELISKKYLVGGLPVSNNSYKGQLLELLADCPSITSAEIGRLNYREDDLIQLVTKYINCKSPSESIELKTTENVKFDFGIVVGAGLSTLNFEYLNNVDFNNSTNITAGVSLLLTMPRTSGRIGVYSELLYRSFNFKGDVVTNTFGGQITTDHFKFQGNLIRWNILLRYTVGKSNLKPFIQGGVGTSLALNNVDQSTRSTVSSSTTTIVPNAGFNGSRFQDQAIILGIGTSYRNFGFELRGESSNGFSSLPEYKSYIKTGYFLVNYKF